MVIFGAGASCDSSPANPLENVGGMQWRPPLANELFDMRFANVITHFPRAKPVITHLLPQIGSAEPVNVERVLENLQSDAAAGDTERYRQLAAVQFYLQAMLVQCAWFWKDTTIGVTNYGTLIDEIRRLKQTVCLVTFNYDTLLEDALSTWGLRFASMADYVKSDYKVIKVHGSANWAHEVITSIDNLRGRDQLQVATEIIDRRPDLEIGKSYEIVTQSLGDIQRGYPIGKSGEKPVLPALAIPVENKPGDEIPAEHRKVLDECLPQITKILVIGWRANESRFLKTLAEGIGNNPRSVQCMVVSRTEASGSKVGSKISESLRAGGVHADSFQVSKGGFTSAIRNHEAEKFLNA